MLIRTKYHWLGLLLTGFYLLMAGIITATKRDTTMVPIYLISACVLLVVWSTSYATISDGLLTKHIFFFKLKSFAFDDIACISPHRKNGKWGYGTIFTIVDRDGKKLTLQPDHPGPFLTMLRESAPQAEFLLESPQ